MNSSFNIEYLITLKDNKETNNINYVFIGIIKYNKLFSTNDAMKAVTNFLRKIRVHIYTFFSLKTA